MTIPHCIGWRLWVADYPVTLRKTALLVITALLANYSVTLRRTALLVLNV